MRIALTLLAAVCLGTVAHADDPKPDPVIKNAETHVLFQLSDPDSAHFRNERVSTLSTQAVCGEVNSKNSMGGYVGYGRFVDTKPASDNPNSVYFDDGHLPHGFDDTWETYCAS